MGSEPADDDARTDLPTGESGLDAELDRAVPTGEAIAFLIVSGGDQPGLVYALTRNTVMLGRAEGSDVHIIDPSVSGHHARIINGSRGFEIEDLESTNGTFVGGERIRRARLRNGDTVTVGSVEFTFLLDRPVDATVALVPARQWGPPSRNAAPGGALMRLPAPPAAHFPSPPMPMPALPPREDEDAGPSLKEIVSRMVRAYRFLKQHTFLIVLSLVIGTGVGAASIFAIPPRQVASCEVRLQPALKANPVEDQQQRPPDDDTLQFFTDAERSFLQPMLVRGTLRKLEGWEPSESEVTAVTGRLKLESLGEHLYRATYKDGLLGGGKPAPAAFLTAHLQNYVDSEITKALREFNAEVVFLRDQLKSVQKDLDRINTEKTSYREANLDRLPEDAEQTHNSRFELENRRAELTAQVRRLQGELAAERQQLDTENPLAQTRYQASQVYRTQLADINRKLSDAYARGLADGHPEVQQLKDEKKRVEELIDSEMRTATTQIDKDANPAYATLQNHVATLQAQLSAARSDLGDTEHALNEIKHVVGDLPRVEQRIQELTQSQEATSRLQSQLFEKLKKAELQLNLERVSAESRYEVVIPPRAGSMKPALTLMLRAGLGLMLGLLVAAMIILVVEGRRMVAETIANMDRDEQDNARSWR